MAARYPAGKLGPPVVGETLAFLANPYQFVKQRVARYGPIFKTGFVGKPTVVMTGAAAQKYVLVGNYRNFLWREGNQQAEPFLEHSLALTDGPLHDSQRKLMSPAFHGRNMPAYIDRMNHVIDARLDTWGQAGTRAFYPEGRQIAFTLASSILLGVEPSVEYDRLIKLWAQYSSGIVSVIRWDVPFTTFGKSMRAMRKLEPFLREIIARQRATQASDALGLLVASRDEDGNAMTDKQLIAQTKLMIFAGYDTTTGTLSWMLAELLQRPDVLERVRAEVRADDRDAPITFEDLKQKPLLDAIIKETLRLHPQSAFALRGVKETFEYEGITIPAGHTVMLAPVYTHRMPEYFAAPDTFDPDRFLAPRDEEAAHPYAWIGFGGGPRICIGEGIARYEIKAMFTRLMRRFDLKLVPGQDFSPLYIPLSRPKCDVGVVYQAR